MSCREERSGSYQFAALSPLLVGVADETERAAAAGAQPGALVHLLRRVDRPRCRHAPFLGTNSSQRERRTFPREIGTLLSWPREDEEDEKRGDDGGGVTTPSRSVLEAVKQDKDSHRCGWYGSTLCVSA